MRRLLDSVVVLVVALVAMSVPARASQAPAGVEQCLTEAFSKVHSELNEPAATLQTIGCLQLEATEVYTGISTFPSQTDRSDCAAACQLQKPTTRSAYFAVRDGSCYCVDQSDLPPSRSDINQTSCCDSGTQADPTCQGMWFDVEELYLLCPLNMSLCTELKYCEATGGCCVPKEEKQDGSTTGDTSEQLLMAQWAGGLLVVVGVGHISYICASRRQRRLDNMAAGGVDPSVFNERHERRLVLPGCNGDEDGVVVLTGISNLQEASRAAAELYPACNRAEMEPDATCAICMDEYPAVSSSTETGGEVGAEPSNSGDMPVETPCKHHFHKDCLVDFFQHKLRTSLEDITCPMCRAPILEQHMDDHSELARLRDTIAEMRGHVRPPRQPRPVRTAANDGTTPSSLEPPLAQPLLTAPENHNTSGAPGRLGRSLSRRRGASVAIEMEQARRLMTDDRTDTTTDDERPGHRTASAAAVAFGYDTQRTLSGPPAVEANGVLDETDDELLRVQDLRADASTHRDALPDYTSPTDAASVCPDQDLLFGTSGPSRPEDHAKNDSAASPGPGALAPGSPPVGTGSPSPAKDVREPTPESFDSGLMDQL